MVVNTGRNRRLQMYCDMCRIIFKSVPIFLKCRGSFAGLEKDVGMEVTT